MNTTLNQTQLWFYDLCDKTFTTKSKSKHINSNTHKHKEKFGFVVKNKSLINQILMKSSIYSMILLKIVEKLFSIFEYKCVYDIQITNITNNEEVNLTINFGYMELKSQFFGLTKKIRYARYNGFRSNEIVKLTIKICSNQSNIMIHYDLEFGIPM